MAFLVLQGPYDGQTRADDSPWPMVMSTAQGTVLGETAADLIAALVPGYDDLVDPADAANPDDVRAAGLVLRWRTCVATASDVQALICADRAKEGRFDPAAMSEEELSALFADKTVPVEDIETWEHRDVPLVLIATDYAPFTDRAPVGGNVLWLDPSDEMAFLRSMANLGLLSFYLHADENDEGDES